MRQSPRLNPSCEDRMDRLIALNKGGLAWNKIAKREGIPVATLFGYATHPAVVLQKDIIKGVFLQQL